MCVARLLRQAVDINCDMGESFGQYRLGRDEEVIKYISSANIACGYHAGDPSVMRLTINLAKEKRVEVGAHPGFPDLLGFGRREMNVSPEDITDYMIYQIGALEAFAHAEGTQLQHVKPHGALYNMAANNEEMAQAVAQSIKRINKDLILLVLAGSRMIEICQRNGIRVACEAFADRAYTREGILAPRRMAGSVIDDPDTIAQRVVMLAKEGNEIKLGKIHSICVHGDNPKASEVASVVRLSLEKSDVEVVPLKRIL